MTTDIELITAAARAGGYTTEGEWLGHGVSCKDHGGRILIFNPLVTRGDAFDLLVSCGMEIARDSKSNTVTVWVRRAPFLSTGTFSVTERLDADPHAATARAITRLAVMLAPQVEPDVTAIPDGHVMRVALSKEIENQLSNEQMAEIHALVTQAIQMKPNTPATQAAVVQVVSSHLRNLRATGALL